MEIENKQVCRAGKNLQMHGEGGSEVWFCSCMSAKVISECERGIDSLILVFFQDIELFLEK